MPRARALRPGPGARGDYRGRAPPLERLRPRAGRAAERASTRSRASTSRTRSAPSMSSTRKSRARSAGATRRPTTSRRMRRIKRVLPEARFIHVIRDGRDVTLSTNKRIVERGHRDPLPAKRSARRWRNRIEKARADGAEARRVPRDPLRGPRHRHRADAHARLRVHRARVRAGDASLSRDGRRAPARRWRERCPRRTGAPSARQASG